MEGKFLTLRWRNARWSVPLEDILYIESRGRHLLIHTATECIEVVGQLNDISAQLGTKDFLRTHQSYVVNMAQIYLLRRGEALLTNTDAVPVSARRQTNVLAVYDWYCERKRHEKDR